MLVITPGDPIGIGPEVVAKALREGPGDVVILGHAEAVERWTGPLPRVDRVRRAPGVRLLDTRNSESPCEVRAIRLATQACLDGRADALVTGPIHKARLHAAGFEYPGHTDFLGHLCGVENPVMGFVGGSLRVCLVTVHLPLSQVAQAITASRVLYTLQVANQSLKESLGIERPRLLVCGLNPHAGDQGLLGREEIEQIQPACVHAQAMGLRVDGPVSGVGFSNDARRSSGHGCGDVPRPGSCPSQAGGLWPKRELDHGFAHCSDQRGPWHSGQYRRPRNRRSQQHVGGNRAGPLPEFKRLSACQPSLSSRVAQAAALLKALRFWASVENTAQ